MICQFIRLHQSAKAPTKAHASDAGFDLYSPEAYGIEPGETVLIDTGIAIELPPGWCASVRPRSGLNRAGIVAGIGLIDPDYRGSIGVTLTNAYFPGSERFHIRSGDRIAHHVSEQVPVVEMAEVEALPMTPRWKWGFGSSGR